MNFYQSIYSYYDTIFPLQPATVDFIKNEIIFESVAILDIGCATGNLSIELAKMGYCVYAFDLNQQIIALANSKLTLNNLSFRVANMIELSLNYVQILLGDCLF